MNALVSFKYKKYATYASKFKTSSIRTTTTPLVYYYYEFNELSTNEHTTLAFQLLLSWTITIIMVVAHVLIIAAFGIIRQTKFGNFYMLTQCSMDYTFVKLLLIM